MITLPLLIALSTQSPAANPSVSVLRTYDLSAVQPIIINQDGERVLLPALQDFGLDESAAGSAWAERDATRAVEFIRALNPEEWTREGRSLGLDGRSQLTVLAPPAIQDSVARTLAFLEQTIGRPTTIVVDMVLFGPNPGIATLPAVLPSADVSRWTSVGSGHESYELSILPGERCRQRAERLVAFVLHDNVEVAERTIGWAIRPEMVPMGTALDAAVAPAPGGVWLALNIRNGRFLDSESKREEPRAGIITNDHSSEHISGPQLRSDPRLANHSLSINSYLPDGKALAFVTTAGLESRVVFVRRVDAPTPLRFALPEDLKRVCTRPATILTRTDMLRPPVAFVRSGAGVASIATLADMARPDVNSPHVLAGIDMGLDTVLSDSLESTTDDWEVHTAGVWIGMFAMKPAPLEAPLALVLQALPAPRLITATIALRRGARDGPTLARAILPIRAGASSTVVLGREALCTAAINIEVASGSVVPSTSLARLFDGLVVTLEPRTSTSGGVNLDVEAHCSWSRTPPRDLEVGGKLPTRVQLMDSDMLDARRMAVFSMAESTPQRVTLGSVGGGVEALTLEIELNDVR